MNLAETAQWLHLARTQETSSRDFGRLGHRLATSSLDEASADQAWRELVNCRPVIDDTVMRT